MQNSTIFISQEFRWRMSIGPISYRDKTFYAHTGHMHPSETVHQINMNQRNCIIDENFLDVLIANNESKFKYMLM